MLGRPVNITCMSDGFPKPSYTITHNDTGISNRTKHTIQNVMRSDSGTYKCVAVNETGNDSACRNLTVGKIIFCNSITRNMDVGGSREKIVTSSLCI